MHVYFVGHSMVHMTWLYSGIWHWLPLLLFIYVIAFLMICLFYYHIVLHHFIRTSTFSLFLTHSLGHFLTTRDLHVQIGCFISLIRCWWARTLREEPEVTLCSIIGFHAFFYSVVSFSLCICLSYHPIPFICSLLSCVHIYMCIAVIMIYHSRFLYLVQVTLDLACIREVFSSRICVTDLRRISAPAYFGKRGVTG